MKNGDFDPYVDEINRLSKRVAELEAALREGCADTFDGLKFQGDEQAWYFDWKERAQALLAKKEGA